MAIIAVRFPFFVLSDDSTELWLRIVVKWDFEEILTFTESILY